MKGGIDVRRYRVIALAVVFGLALAVPGFAQAAPKTYVANKAGDPPPSGCTHSDCTLREAVIAANGHPGHDTIKLLAKTYTLAIPGTGDDVAADGDLDLTEGVSIVGKGAAKTIVDGGGAAVGEAAFEVIGPGGAAMSGLTVRNSISSTGDAGISVRAAQSLHMKASRVVHNQVQAGGGYAGIQAQAGSGAKLVLDHVTVADNSSLSGCCTGVYVNGSAALSHVTATRNTSIGCCNGINAGYGGGDPRVSFIDVRVIDNDGPSCCQGIETGSSIHPAIVRRTVIKDNDGTGCCNGLDMNRGNLRRVVVAGNDGGSCCNGIEINGGRMIDTVVDDNDGTGGYQGVETSVRHVTIARTTISHNDATGAGMCCSGLFTNAGAVKLANVTISANTAAGDAGGIRAISPMKINNATVTDNVADSDNAGGGSGGGIQVIGGYPVRIQNSILAGNSVGSTGTSPDCSGTLMSAGHNLIGDTAGCTVAGANATNLLGVDPLLAPLRHNGGFTKTHALRRHSKAINHGSPKNPGAGGTACDKHDQRGVRRPQGPRCDIGAFERKKHHHHHH